MSYSWNPPFIPARTHAHSRSRSWFSDALDEGAWKVESRLLPALKAIVLATQNAKQEDKPYLSDALTFLIAALQDARHMRIIAKFGFAAARLLQKEKEDPLLNREQLERIAPLMQKKRETLTHSTYTAGLQSARSSRAFNSKRPFIPQKTRFFQRKKEAAPKPSHESGRKLEREK